MKKFFRLVSLMSITLIAVLLSQDTVAQKWSDLTDEQKMMKAKEFRADNLAYLKNTLKMTDDQMNDIDNVNICYLATLDRIDRYGKTDEDKEKYAKTASTSRGAQLDAIMGVENHKLYHQYLSEKIKKARGM
jgi:hypothetical protein